jgi:hypothetical protein
MRLSSSMYSFATNRVLMLFCWDLAQFQASKFTNQLAQNSQIPSEANNRIIQTCQNNLFSSLQTQITHCIEIHMVANIILLCDIWHRGETSATQHTLMFINGKKCISQFHAANTNAWDNNLARKEHTKPASQLILQQSDNRGCGNTDMGLLIRSNTRCNKVNNNQKSYM